MPTENLRVATLEDTRVGDEELVLAIGRASEIGLKGLSGIEGNEWYRDIEKAEFEGLLFPVPKGYDEILKKHYKDYMSLPPEEKRVPKHLDFDIFETGRG